MSQSDFLKQISCATLGKTTGTFYTKDRLGKNLILEWNLVDSKNPKYSDQIMDVTDSLVEAYSQVELQFLKAYPEAIESEILFKSLAPLFKNGSQNIDWEEIGDYIKDVLENFFHNTDWENHSDPDDIHIFVNALEKGTKKHLGFIQFSFSSSLPYGAVSLGLYDGIHLGNQDLDIEEILLSSIFRIIPNVNRILFHTRSTNFKSIQLHMDLGFQVVSDESVYWKNLEYRVDLEERLQKKAQTFIDLNSLKQLRSVSPELFKS